MSARFFAVFFLYTLLGACSRDYDVTIPQAQVKPDVDCSVGSVVDPVVTQFNVVTKLEGSGGEKELAALTNLVPGEYEEHIFVGLGIADVYASFSHVGQGVSTVLDDGVVAQLNNVVGNISVAGNDVMSNAALTDSEVVKLVLEGESDRARSVTVTFRLNISATEVREGCEIFGRITSEEVQNESGDTEIVTKVIRQWVQTFTVDFDLTRSDNVSSKLIRELDGGAVGTDYRGSSVSTNGRFIIVGVPGDDGGDLSYVLSGDDLSNTVSSNSGAVRLYEKEPESHSVSYCGLIKASNARPADLFGSTVLFRGDYLYVSSPGEDSAYSGVALGPASDLVMAYSQFDSGAVYEFRVDSCSSVTETAYFKSPDNKDNLIAPDSGFGSTLAEFDGQLFVGAPKQRKKGSTAEVGAVYQFFKDNGTWLSDYQHYSHLLDHHGQRFGSAISVSRELVLIGAPSDSADSDELDIFDGRVAPADIDANTVSKNNPQSGAAVLFFRALTEQASVTALGYLKPRESDEGDQFGSSVAIAENQLFVSAPLEDSASSLWGVDAFQNKAPALGSPLDGNYGAVYQYNIDSAFNAKLTTYIKSRLPVAGGQFGRVLAADKRYLLVGQQGLSAHIDSVETDAHIAVFDHVSLVDPIYLSVVESDVSKTPVVGDVDSIDFYAGSLVLGIPNAEVSGEAQAGAFAIWQ